MLFQFLFFLIFCKTLLFIIQKAVNFVAKERFRRDFLLFLNQIILNMQSGMSFRRSYQTSIPFFEVKMQKTLRETYGFVTFSQQFKGFEGDSFKKYILKELIEVDKDKQTSFLRLKNLRTSIEMENFFRHRSREITSSMRFQAGLLTFLFLSLLIFVILQFGFLKNIPVLMISISLFLIGLSAFVFLGKRSKWKL